MKVIWKPCITRVKMGGGFMENIFDCNEGKMQIFSPLCKNIFSAQVLALCFGISTGSRLESARKFETSYEVIGNKPTFFHRFPLV